MNVSERASRQQVASAIDFDRFRLRRFVESLAPEQIETHGEPVDLADVAAIFEGNDKTVWFSAVGPERQELVGNVTGSRARIAQAFGVEPAGLLQEIQRRLRGKPHVVEVARQEAPVQQVVLAGDDADLTTLPV